MLDSNKYTKESWTILIEKLSIANKVIADENAKKEDVENAQKELEDAISGLVFVNNNGNGSGNGNNNNSNNNSGNEINNGNENKHQNLGNGSSLPKTGGTASVLAVIFGGILAAGGTLLGRKK